MPTIILSLTINLRDSTPQTVCAKQKDADSRVLEVALLDGSGPCSLADVAAAVLYVKKPDGTHVFTEGTLVDSGQGLLHVPLTAQALACAGVARCEILLYGDGGSLLSTIPFHMAAIGCVRDEDAIVSSNEYSALTETMLASKELIARMEELMGEIGPGDLSEVGVQIAAHNTDEAAHEDLREALGNLALEGYTKAEIDEMMVALGGGETPGLDGYTKEETKQLLANHSGDPHAHDHLLQAISDVACDRYTKDESDRLVATHNADQQAHGDIRQAIATAGENHYTKDETEGLVTAHDEDASAHMDIREAVAAVEEKHYTKDESDRLVTTHNADGQAHSDIRLAIATAAENHYTKDETEGLVTAHDEDASAHMDIRGAVAAVEEMHYTKDESDRLVATHNADGQAHGDIRQAITTAAENHYTKTEADRYMAEHDEDASAHNDIRQALAGKGGKPVVASCTLTARGWAGSEAPYTQSVVVSGAQAGGLWHYDIAGQANAAQVAAFAQAMVWATGEADGVCHFAAAGQKPEVDLPVVVELIG